MEFVFASHSFDVWESWMLEGSLEECKLVNCRNPMVSCMMTFYSYVVYAVTIMSSGSYQLFFIKIISLSHLTL